MPQGVLRRVECSGSLLTAAPLGESSRSGHSAMLSVRRAALFHVALRMRRRCLAARAPFLCFISEARARHETLGISEAWNASQPMEI